MSMFIEKVNASRRSDAECVIDTSRNQCFILNRVPSVDKKDNKDILRSIAASINRKLGATIEFDQNSFLEVYRRDGQIVCRQLYVRFNGDGDVISAGPVSNPSECDSEVAEFF